MNARKEQRRREVEAMRQRAANDAPADDGTGTAFAMLMAVAVIVTLLGAWCAGCSTWQSTTLRALNTASLSVAAAPPAARKACKVVLADCIKRRENPCSALDTCHAVERQVVQGNVAAQAAVHAGLVAIADDDRPAATAALGKVLAILVDLSRALAAYGVVL